MAASSFQARVDAPGDAYVSLSQADVGYEIVEGDPAMQLILLRDTEGPGGRLWAGIIVFQPSTISYTFQGDDTLHLLEGEARVTVEGEPAITLRAGDVASFVKGRKSTWEFLTPVKEFFVLSDLR